MSGDAIVRKWQKKATKREVVISFEQEELMLSWATAMCHDLFHDIMACTPTPNSGCRMREAFSLRWRDINFFNKHLMIGYELRICKNRTIPFGDTPSRRYFSKGCSLSPRFIKNDKVFKGINEKKLYRLWWQNA